MKLSFTEELLLSLYLELFNRPYNPNDDRKYEEVTSILERHIEMHNVCFLFQNLNIYVGNFEFISDWRGPYSSLLQSILNKLDHKEKSITEFYKNYDKKEVNNQGTNEQQQFVGLSNKSDRVTANQR